MHVMPLKVSGSILKYKYYILYKDNRFTKGIKFCLLWNQVKTLSLVRRSKLVKSQYIKNQKRNIWLKNTKENFKAGNNLKKKKSELSNLALNWILIQLRKSKINLFTSMVRAK